MIGRFWLQAARVSSQVLMVATWPSGCRGRNRELVASVTEAVFALVATARVEASTPVVASSLVVASALVVVRWTVRA